MTTDIVARRTAEYESYWFLFWLSRIIPRANIPVYHPLDFRVPVMPYWFTFYGRWKIRSFKANRDEHTSPNPILGLFNPN